eukprot:SAG22_NODE_2511_length_2491_cov_1.441890_5_plen_68_part_00
MRTMLQELLDMNVVRRLSADEARSPYIHPELAAGYWVPPKSLRPVFSTPSAFSVYRVRYRCRCRRPL